ncbi:unnamed protein product [Tilletia controversa]|nr:unnamed protein product [Tilletia controversa]
MLSQAASAFAVRTLAASARSSSSSAAAAAAVLRASATRRRPTASISTSAQTHLAIHRHQQHERQRQQQQQRQRRPRDDYLPNLAPLLTSRRAYSTAPNQNQVASTFGNSFVQFILILSKVARITLYTAIALLAVGTALFEGTHQYVERVSMPRAAQAASLARVQAEIRALLAKHVSEEELACFLSWVEEAQDEAWAPSSLVSGGTDPRLGLRGRHALRSAFIAAEWGSGLDPSFFFAKQSFFGRPTRNQESSAALQKAAATLEQGLMFAESYLIAALHEAERKGMRLPEPAVQRAQLLSTATSAQHGASVLVPEIDPTVFTLEMRLASVRERQGRPHAQQSAIESYERIFDALASASPPAESAESSVQVTSSTTPTPARLVRLATKIGTLHHTLGHRDEAESWLLRAVELASEHGAHGAEAESVSTAEVLSGTEQGSSSSWAFWKRKTLSDSAPAGETLTTATAVVPSSDANLDPSPSSPGLTRALISALIGLSAWYAIPPTPGTKVAGHEGISTATGTSWLASLEEATRIQSSALQLARLEQTRLSVLHHSEGKAEEEGKSVGRAERLHAAWVEMNEGTLCMHLAETLFGLQAQPRQKRAHLPATPSSPSTSQSSPQKKFDNRYILPISWLHQASLQTAHVLETLSTPLTDAEAQFQSRARAKRDAKAGEDARAGYAAVEQALPMGYKLRPEWRSVAAAGASKGGKGADTEGEGQGQGQVEPLDLAMAVPAFRLVRDASRMQTEIHRMLEALERKGRS